MKSHSVDSKNSQDSITSSIKDILRETIKDKPIEDKKDRPLTTIVSKRENSSGSQYVRIKQK